MKNKINNLSDVFREAKKHLWDGFNDDGTSYICYAIDRVGCGRLGLQAKDVILSRFPKRVSKWCTHAASPHDVASYLIEVLGVPEEGLSDIKVQQYRKDWLTALEEEFKPKLKPKKGYSIHHIDGDIGNNDLINLTYVKINESSNWK